MANNQIKIGVGFQVDKSGLNDLISSLRQIQHTALTKDPTGNLKTGLNESAQAAEKLENILNKSWNSKLNQLDLSKVSQGIKETYGNVNKMKTELEKSGAVGINAYNHMASAILNTNLQLKQSNKLLDEMAESMANTIKWGITSSIFNNITNSITEAFHYTKKLDSSLNDIRIVTDKSAESMEKFARQANNAAKGLGASTLDYTEASLIYYQQGLGDTDVQARTETTLKAANVTGQYAEEVSEQLTAVWNGYKVSAQEAELYVDKLAAVAASTAADLEELSTGMSKVASAANSMGVDIDQLNAQLATIVSVTRQAPESVGTALKTIYARMSDLKLGGTDEDGLGLGDVSGTMESMGINVLDASGNLREMGDVIEEVATKWDTWTEAQKTAMAQVMAGKRQYNNLVALFENWDMYTNSLNESANAAGTLQKQQDVYLESTEAHLQQLRTEAERTYDILFNQETVNGFADGISGALGIFNDFIESIGGGGNAILYFGSLVATVFNQQIARAINTQINNLKAYRNNLAGKDLKTQIIQSFTGEAGRPQQTRVERAIDMRNAAQGKVVSHAAIKEEAKVATQILAVEKNLTQEQHQQLIEIQQRVGLVRQEYEDLMSYKKVFQELGLKEDTSWEQAVVELDKMNSKLNDTREKLSAIRNITGSQKDIGVQLKTVKNNLLNEENSKYLSDDMKDKIRSLPNSKKIANNTNREIIERAILQILRAQTQEYSKMTQAVDNLQLKEEGRDEELKEQEEALKDFVEEETEEAERTGKISTAIKGATAAVGALTAVAGGFSTIMSKTASEAEKINAVGSMISGAATSIGMAFGPWGMVIGGAVSAISTMISSIWAQNARETEEAIEENKKKWEELHSEAEEFKNNKKTLLSLKSEFERLSKGVSDYGDNISLSTSEYEDYHNIVNQIVEISPELIAGYNAEGQAIVDKNSLIERSIELMKQEQIERKKALVSSTEMDLFYEGAETNLDVADTQLTEQKNIVGGKQSEYDNYVQATINQVEYGIAQVKNAMDAAGETFNNPFENTSFYKKGVFNDEAIKQDFETFLNLTKQIDDNYNLKDIYGESIKVSELLWRTGNNLAFDGATTSTEIIESNKNRRKILRDEQNKEKQFTDEYIEQQKQMNDKILTSIEVYNEEYLQLATQEQLIVQSYINSFKFDEFNNTTFQQGINKVETFITKLSLLGDEQQDAFAKLLDSNNFNNYQEYVNAIGNFAKQSNMDLSLIQEALGLNSITFDDATSRYSIGTEATKIGNQLQAQLNINKDQFNVYREFTEQELLNGDVENLQIGGVNLKAFIGENGIFDTEEWQKYKTAVRDTDKDLKVITATITQLKTNINSLTAGLDEFKKEGKLSEETIANLERLYPELSDIQLKNSHMYLNALREIREYEETVHMQQLEEQKEKYAEQLQFLTEKWSNIQNERDFNNLTEDQQIQFNADMTKIEEAIQKIIDTEYEITVQVNADIQSDIDSGFGLVDEFQKLSDLIPENLEISMDKAQEIIASGNAGILENSKQTSNETIKLDKETMNVFIDNKQKELEETKKAMIAELQMERGILVARREAAEKEKTALEAAQAAYKKGDVAAAKKQLQIAYDMNAEYQAQTQRLNELLKQEGQYYTEKGKLVQDYNKDVQEGIEDSGKVQQESEIAATMTQALEVEKRLDNNQLVHKSYVEVGEANKWSQNPVGRPPVYTLKSATVTSSSFNDIISTPSEGNKEDTKPIEYKPGSVEAIDQEAYVNAMLELLKDGTFNNEILKTDAKINENSNLIGGIDSAINFLNGAGLSLNKAQTKAGTKDGKDKKEEKKAEDEIDRYWELNKAIENVEESLSDLDKQQEKLYGKEKINSLKEENQLLAQQAEAYKILAESQKAEASELQGILSAYGVVFDAQGGIANYSAATQAALETYNQAVAAYNAGLDEATFEVTEKAYENFKSTLERYEALYYNEMRETQNTLDEIHRQELENNLEAWEIEIQLKLDTNDLKRQWNNFIKEINRDFTLVDENLGLTMKNLVKDAQTYTGQNGDIATLISNMNIVKAEIDKLNSGGSSTMFASVSEAQEKLKELNSQLQTSAIDLRSLWEEAWNTYLEGIDQAADQCEDMIKQYQRVNEEIEYQKELIELMYGEDAYELMNQYYEAQKHNTSSQIASYKAQAEMWEKQYKIAKKRDEQTGKTSKDTQKFYELWQDAQQNVNNLVIDYIKLLKEDYKNVINQVLTDLEKKLFGEKTSFDEIKTQWDLIKKQSEGYYDNIERVYEISSLSGKYEQAISKATGATQKKLQEAHKQEMDYLKNKEHLSEYDLEIANAKFDITMKQIALEEARNNKTAMKLTRGTDGNWSYQYVADQDDVAAKEQDLSDARANYYQTAKDGYNQNMENIMSSWQDYKDEVSRVSTEYAGEENKDTRENLLKELNERYYGPNGILTKQIQNFETTRVNLGDATLQSILGFNAEGTESYEYMTEDQKKLLDDIKNGTITSYDEMLIKAQEVCLNTSDSWSSLASQIAEDWYKNPESVSQSILKAYENIQTENSKYDQGIKDLGTTAGQKLGEDGVLGQLKALVGKTNKLNEQNKVLVEKVKERFPKYRKQVEKIKIAWENVETAIKNATTSANNYLSKINSVKSAVDKLTTSLYAAKEAQLALNAAQSGEDTTTTITPKTGDGNPKKDKSKDANTNDITWTQNGGQYYQVNQSSSGSKEYILLDEKPIKGTPAEKYDDNVIIKTTFATGGYTGEWTNGDTDGRLAWLHQKELVLNAADTKNILSVVNVVRDLVHLEDSIQTTIMNNINKMLGNLIDFKNYKQVSQSRVNTDKENMIDNNVFHINAHFPNANDVTSIQEAIMNLPNIASQYVARNKK